jgi:hypothetical protein
MHFPYKTTMVDGKAVRNPAYLRPVPMMKGSFVVMADKNPSQNIEPAVGVGPGKKSTSNHGDLGSVYLMYSGAVGWKKDDADSMVSGDDIYTINSQNNANPDISPCFLESP